MHTFYCAYIQLVLLPANQYRLFTYVYPVQRPAQPQGRTARKGNRYQYWQYYPTQAAARRAVVYARSQINAPAPACPPGPAPSLSQLFLAF
jgi:hypothetical protein